MDRQQDLMFSKNFYLFLYNAIQFLLFFTITASCLLGYAFQQNSKYFNVDNSSLLNQFLNIFAAYFSRVYYSLGSMVIFAVSLTYLEPIHALTGVTNSHWLAPFLLVSMLTFLYSVQNAVFSKHLSPIIMLLITFFYLHSRQGDYLHFFVYGWVVILYNARLLSGVCT